MALPPVIASLAEVSDRYDGYLVDQWGVLHDGVSAFPAALAALARLKAAGRRVVILSNSGRSGAENAARMAAMGIHAGLYDRVLSAGDDAVDALAGERDPAYRGLGRRLRLYARASDRPALLDLGYTAAPSVAEADFLYVHSMPPQPAPPAAWLAELEEARARGLTLICANPDVERVEGAHEILAGPGAVAAHYDALGGVSHYHGKPWPRIYRTALRLLDLPPSRVLAIGDSLVHDIAGARAAGIDGLFLVQGVHRARIDLARPETLAAELAAHPAARPDYVMDALA